MVRIAGFLFCLVAFHSIGQQLEQSGRAYSPKPVLYRMPGLLSASATYAPGIMLNRDQLNYNLHAFAEYHISRRVSVKSDSYLFLNSTNSTFEDLTLFRSYFGMFYHLNTAPFGQWDLKLGFLPGITYGESNTAVGATVMRSKSLAPSFSTAIGFDYYVWNYFHFFSQVAYTHASLRGWPQGTEEVDELMFSAGLGFQIPTRK